MKKTLLLLSLISFSSIITAQVKVNQNAANSAINTSSAFMDASSSPLWNGTTNQGKGMLYPRVDLVNYTAMSHAGPFNASNNPNYFDGLLVFNTATGVAGIGADSVFPGYYYYRNTTTNANGGHWVSLKGIKGDDGSIGPIGPQGVQGIAGNDGLIGASGAQGPTGVAGANGSNGSTGANGVQGPTGVAGTNGSNGATGATGLQGLTGATGANGTNGANGPTGVTGSTGATGLTGATGTAASSSSGIRIGFSASTTWVCPTGVTSITVELWGAGGGSGWHYFLCAFSSAREGGNGGSGGYNAATYTVIPGNSYVIQIGQGGALGAPVNQSCGYCTGSTKASGGTNGLDGGSSSFDGILMAPGGGGGFSATASANGANGINGSVTNYNYPVTNYGTRTFIPSNFLTPVPGCCSIGGLGPGNYPCGGQYNLSSCVGEKGYCVISY